MRRDSWLAAGIVAAVLVAACASPFATPPTTVSATPADRTVDVPLSSQVFFKFSRPVLFPDLVHHFKIDPAVPGIWNGDGPTWAFQPEALLELIRYTVSFSAFSDATGHPIAAHSWSFTTTIVPRVVGARDDASNPLDDTSEVEKGSKLTIFFNTPMSTSATTVTGNGQPVELDWAADDRSASLPTAGLSVGTYAIAVTAGRDQFGHILQAGWKVTVDIAYVVHIATRHLPFPALVQIPNDGYGARPQVGVQAAAMIFEYQTEGSIQRLTALYTDAPDVVGPTRSGRRISMRLVRHYHGNLFLSGLSDAMHAVLAADPVPAWFDSPPGFYRDPSRYAPDNLMLKGDAILADEQASGTAAYQPLQIGRPDLGTGAAVGSFGVDEHRSTYTYDPVTGTYSKVEDGETMTDASLNKPDQIFMVLVLHAHEFLVPDIESGCCTHGRDFDLDSGGPLDIYYRGQQTTGSWSAADRASPLVFKNAAGVEFKLPQGLVWVDVVGN